MEAPDKIYTDNRGVYAEHPVFSQADANVEYLRKYALLEWAKDMKEETEDVTKQHPEDESLWAEMHWWEVVIAKLNSM